MVPFHRWLSGSFLVWMPALLLAQTPRVIDPKLYYLGTPGDPEWQEFAGKTTPGRRLDLRFSAQVNTNENTLFIRQRDVKLEWGVELNRRKLGKLFVCEQDLIQALAVPARRLRGDENTLSIIPPKE